MVIWKGIGWGSRHKPPDKIFCRIETIAITDPYVLFKLKLPEPYLIGMADRRNVYSAHQPRGLCALAPWSAILAANKKDGKFNS